AAPADPVAAAARVLARADPRDAGPARSWRHLTPARDRAAPRPAARAGPGPAAPLRPAGADRGAAARGGGGLRRGTDPIDRGDDDVREILHARAARAAREAARGAGRGADPRGRGGVAAADGGGACRDGEGHRPVGPARADAGPALARADRGVHRRRSGHRVVAEPDVRAGGHGARHGRRTDARDGRVHRPRAGGRARRGVARVAPPRAARRGTRAGRGCPGRLSRTPSRPRPGGRRALTRPDFVHPFAWSTGWPARADPAGPALPFAWPAGSPPPPFPSVG